MNYQEAGKVAQKLERVLDLLEFSPAFVKTSDWDIIAWNRAATRILTDYQNGLPPTQPIADGTDSLDDDRIGRVQFNFFPQQQDVLV